MAYQPIFDGTFPVPEMLTATEALDWIASITDRKMMITDLDDTVRIRGTKSQLLSWLNDVYIDTASDEELPTGWHGGYETHTANEVWAFYTDKEAIVLVA